MLGNFRRSQRSNAVVEGGTELGQLSRGRQQNRTSSPLAAERTASVHSTTGGGQANQRSSSTASARNPPVGIIPSKWSSPNLLVHSKCRPQLHIHPTRVQTLRDRGLAVGLPVEVLAGNARIADTRQRPPSPGQLVAWSVWDLLQS